MWPHRRISLRLDVLVNIRVLLCVILFCGVFIQIHQVHDGSLLWGWPWRQLRVLLDLSGYDKRCRHLLCPGTILDRAVYETLGVFVLLFNRLVLSLQVYVPDVNLKWVLERVWSVDRGMPVYSSVLVFIVLRSRRRARLESATLSEEMKLWPFLEWVLLNAALDLVGVALDLLVADVQVLLYVEATVEVDRGGKGGRGMVLLETVLLLSG